MNRARILDVLTGLAAVTALTLAVSSRLKSSEGIAPRPDRVDKIVELDSTLLHDGERMGSAKPKVTIVEFGDYECPACRFVSPGMHALLREFPDEVQIVYRHMPLTYHKAAYPAARAATCASAQAKFRDFHEALYSTSDWMSARPEDFLRLAVLVNVPDSVEFERCVRSDPRVRLSNIERDLAAAKKLGLRGTPAIIVGNTLLGPTPDSARLVDLVRAHLGERTQSRR